MTRLSTHVLDVATGVPAAGVTVELFALPGGEHLATGSTDSDGRVDPLEADLASGEYRLRFHVGPYFEGLRLTTLYPIITIDFVLGDPPADHLHLPVLVSPFGYSTYRGS